MLLYHILNFFIFWILFFFQRLIYGYALDVLNISFKDDKSIYIPILSLIISSLISIKFFNYYSLKKSVEVDVNAMEEETLIKDLNYKISIFAKLRNYLKWAFFIVVGLFAIVFIFVKSNLNEIKDLNKKAKEIVNEKNQIKTPINLEKVDWQFFKSTSDGYTMYFDQNSIKNDNGNLTYWVLLDFGENSEDGVKSTLSFTQINCNSKNLDYRALKDYNFTENMAKGRIKQTFDQPTEWSFYPFKDSEGYKHLNKLCSK